jgi:multidrug efflux pump subunit AcrB
MNFKPSNFAIKKATVIFLMIILTLFLGLSSYNQLPREWAPDIQVPILIVSTPYIGASPEDVENSITQQLEKKFGSIEGLKKLSSSSVEGASIITLEFNIGFDVSEARSKIREALDTAARDLPSDAEDSSIIEINISESPIITISLSGTSNLLYLRDIADNLKDEIEGVSGILEVKVAGGLEREMQVDVDPLKLQNYNISLNKIIQTIRDENRNIPNGSIKIDPLNYSVRVLGEVKSAEDIGNMILRNNSGSVVYIKDVANVNLGNKEQTTRARSNGLESVSLSVAKRSGINIVRVSDDVKNILQSYREQFPRLNIQVLSDRSVEIKQNVSDLENNIYTGMFFVVVALFLFMGFQNSLLVGIAIPLSMLVSFIVLSLVGIELNFIVLFSLILSLGMLVDNAIVVVENIYRHVQGGKSRIEAAKTGIGEVAYPVISSTFTTLAAFLPLLFMPGIIGEFMKYLPLTLTITLASSLFVALFYNTVICSRIIKKPKVVHNVSDIELIQKYTLLRKYRKILEFCIRFRWLVIIAVVVLWFAIMMAFGKSGLGTEFFPQGEPEEAVVNIESPFGISLDAADEIVLGVEKRILDFEEDTKSIVASVGQSREGGETSNSGPSKSNILLTFPRWEDWKVFPSVVVQRVREILGNTAGAKVTVTRSSNGPPTGKPVNIEISGPELQKLKELSLEVQEKIKGVKNLVNLEDNLELRRSEIRVILDREKLSRLGLTTAQVGGILRTAISGNDVSTYKIGDDEYDIKVRIQEDYKKKISDLQKLNFISSNGESITLQEIARIEQGPAFGSIRRVSKKRVVTVSANAAEGASGTNVLKEVQDTLTGYTLPAGYRLRYTGENEDRQESQGYLVQSFIVAIFLIFLILVSQFNSLIHPVLILVSVFLCLMGVFLGLIIHQRPFSIILGGIGTVSLAGIVVNNSIVLIDYIRQLRERGIELQEAVILASMTRLRPIVLTAITTIISLFPVVWGMDINFYRFPEVIKFGSSSGDFWIPMSLAIIYGLGVSTVLTLFILPVLYIMVENTKIKFSKLFSGSEKFSFSRKKRLA